MDYKNEQFQSDDDFDSSNGFNDHLSNTSGYNSSGQSRMSDTNGLSKAELRKTNKPIMEKRRRARINHCLNELKSLILEAMKKDPARHTKLEKADILEMTVKHLQSVQRQQLNLAIQTDPSVIHKFKTGFVECAEEVTRYISQLDGVDTTVRQGLMSHLNKCATSLDQIGSMTNFNNGYCGNMSNLLANNPLATATITAPASNMFPTLGHELNSNNVSQAATTGTPLQMGGVQLIPSRLPTGELALIVPNASAGSVLNNNSATNGSHFPVWPPPSLVHLPTHMQTTTLNHNISPAGLTDFSVNAQQNMSAFTKPITVLQQHATPPPTVVAPPSIQHMKSNNNVKKANTKSHHMTHKTKLFQSHNNFAQNSTATASPPLSPISSVSSHGDESSILHTSSEYGASRPATPPQEICHIEKQDFSGVFTTPPSSANSSLSSSHSSINLQQQQVTSTSGRQIITSRKRSLNSTDSADSSDEPSAKKFSNCTNELVSTDDEGSCWRPW